VVGHMKTCSIVALGWIFSGRRASDRGIFGIMLAIVGIIAYVLSQCCLVRLLLMNFQSRYTMIMYQHKQQQQKL
jgi:hypothetical protein